MRMDDEWSYFFDNGRGINLAGCKILDCIKEGKAVFIKASLNTIVNNIYNFFVRFEVNFCNGYTLLETQYFL